MSGETGTAVPEPWCPPASSEVCVNCPVLDNRAGQSLNTKYFNDAHGAELTWPWLNKGIIHS